ncbi:MAG: hypothetical protein R3C01_10405 [Planctomycetaceae bacterium]
MTGIRSLVCGSLAGVVLWAATGAIVQGADAASNLEAIRKIGHKGEGHAAAQAAVKELSAQGVDVLPEVLKAMGGANPLATNWLRGTFETIAADALKNKQPLPMKELTAFFENREHDGRARRLAYEWMIQVDPKLADQIVPLSLDDPSAEMRRDAVARLLKQGEAAQAKGDTENAVESFQAALSGATDDDQVTPLIDKLGKLDVKVNRVQHFGLLTSWKVIGPFDNVGSKNFSVVYPPENEVKFDAEYDGQLGKVRWEEFVSDNEKGEFDLAKLTKPHKGAIDYAATTFNSGSERDVEFRIATANAWKLWVNGELVFAREEYHRGMRFDQYRIPGHLKQGDNLILLKVCQNEQTEDWAQDWSFQFRICDLTGRALHSGE